MFVFYDASSARQSHSFSRTTLTYRRTSNIRLASVGNDIFDHLYLVGVLPVCAAPTTSSFSNEHLVSIDCTTATASRGEKHINFGIWCKIQIGVQIWS